MAVGRCVDFEKLKSTMSGLLPEDGTPVLNRVMRVMLARKLEQPIDEETFFKARDTLLSTGAIGRLRGQGGQMFLVKPETAPPSTEPEPASAEAWPEANLMVPLKDFLEGPFRKGLDLPESGAFIVQDTSALGPHKGRWARPDFILVSAMRFKLLPGSQVDLHSFELKTETGGSMLAIHEALAQTRFTHFGHLVWHLPEGSKFEPMLDDITTHCEEHGIGLIRMRDPLKAALPDGCEILVDPRRKPTLSAIIDGFLESRLLPEQKETLLRVVGGAA
jgi:hypothetical protein